MNCPIDDVSVGRCWFYLTDNVCPRHGDVSEAVDYFVMTGELTPEGKSWTR